MREIENLKPLNPEQLDRCREVAIERVKKRIGARPSRSKFRREMGSQLTFLDIIAGIVFLSALFVSSVHIIFHMGKLADASYSAVNQTGTGMVISRSFYVSIHQWMVIPLAEGSMILFLVMFGMTENNWRKWVYMFLAIVAVTFVLIANIQSNIGLLESILAPVFTIGIGLKFEQLIVLSLKRRDEVNHRYLVALSIWEQATEDATKHPDYLPFLRQEIWQKLASLKVNQQYIDAAPAFKLAAAQNEIQRAAWIFETESVDNLNGGGVNELNKRPFGNIPHEQVDLGSMTMLHTNNGHIASEKNVT